MKLCSKCNKEKSSFEFSKNRSHADGRDSICKDCRKVQIKLWRQNNPDKCKEYQTTFVSKHSVYELYAYQALSNKKNSGKFTIEISVEELALIAENTKVCPICGTTIDYSPRKGRIHDNSPSLDRMDNGQTITASNTWVICHQCNRTKSNRSIEEFVAYMDMAVKRLRSQFDVLNTGDER